jgi:predicted nucleotidyltransferase
MIDAMTPREILEREQARLVALLEARGARDIRLFGSLARGDDDAASDIDLLVGLPDGRSAGAELMAVLGLSEELSRALGVRVEVVTERTLRDEVRAAVLADAVTL